MNGVLQAILLWYLFNKRIMMIEGELQIVIVSLQIIYFNHSQTGNFRDKASQFLRGVWEALQNIN